MPVLLLELAELAGVDQPGDHLAHVIGLVEGDRDDAVELVDVALRGPVGAELVRQRRRRRQLRNDVADDLQCVGVVVGEMIADAGERGMGDATTEVLGRDHFAGRGFDQRGTAQEDGPLVAHDDGLVADSGNVGATGGAGAQDRRDLRDPGGRHPGLVVEDPAEMVTVRKDLVLPGQERSTRVDEIDAGQTVLGGDFLCAEVLLDSHRVIGATLDRWVVARPP